MRDLQRLARTLDSAVRIPGTNVRFGVDAVIGLLPGVGDVAGAVMASYIIIAGVRMGAPASVLARMLLNVGIDTAFGAVPILGDVFDVAWRANTRNVALLERHTANPAHAQAASRAVVLAVILALVILLGLTIAAAYVIVRAIAHAI